MYLGKSYSAHCSFVHDIATQQQWVLTTSVSDECLFKWRLQIEEHSRIGGDKEDEQIDAIDKEDFASLIRDVLPIRNELMDIQMQVDEADTPEYEIEMQGIIGRRAFAARMNLFYDFDERLIYTAGCNFVIAEGGAKSKVV